MQEELSRYMDTLPRHPVFDNEYFKLLRVEKLTPKQYEVHRANFFYRTMATVMGIAHICSAAAQHHDQKTLILFAYILNEECGDGEQSRCHEQLMEQAHNLFGYQEYGSAALRVQDLESAMPESRNEDAFSLVTAETKAYREQLNVMMAKNYPTMLGVAYALETHASIMLSEFRNMFDKNRTQMTEVDYKRMVQIYFNCHLESGVEDRHASDARQCILSNCRDATSLADIIYGIEGTLEAQLNMWNGMYNRITQENIAATGHAHAVNA
jgi:hypothetical protein